LTAPSLFTRRYRKKGGKNIRVGRRKIEKKNKKEIMLPIQKQNKFCLPRNFETATSGSFSKSSC